MSINWKKYPSFTSLNTSDKIIVSAPDGNTKNISFPFTSNSSGITFTSDIYFTNLTEAEQEFSVMVGPDGKLYKSTHPGERSRIQIRNDEGATIPAGAPIYSKGEVGGSERIKVGICDSSDPAKMPCIGIVETELNTTDNKDGFATTQGVYNTNISGFTGLSEGNILYVNGGSAPHLTQTKPTNGDLIQNVGVVIKTNGTICQGLLVAAIGRTNDVPWPLYVDHTNQRVGIGTSSPTEKLHIEDATNPKLLIKDSNGAGVYLQAFNSYGILSTVGSTSNLRLGINDVEKMRLTSDGKLGISETTPEGLLHVYNPNDNGTTRTSVFEHRYGVNSLSQYARYGIIVKSADVTPSLGITNQTYNSVIQSFLYASPFTAKDIALQTLGGSVLIGRNATSGATEGRLTIKGFGDTSSTNSLAIQNSSSTTVSTIKDDGSATFSGQVTIPATPVASTDAASKGYVDAQIGANNDLQEVTDNGATTTNAITFAGGTSTSDLYLALSATTQRALSSSGTDSLQIGDAGVNDIRFKNAVGSVARFLANGNVLIGTTADDGSNKLQVNGNVKATRIISDILRDTNENGHLVTTVTNASNTATTVGNTATANTLTLGVKSGGVVNIPNGSLGIGTATPSRPLHVKNTSSQTVAVFDGGNNNAGEIGFMGNGTSGDTYVTIGAVANDMSFSAGASERMRLTSAGRLGIGTSSPSNKLQIETLNNNDGFRLNYPSTNSTQYPFFIGKSDDSNYVRVNANIIALKRNGATSTIKTEGSSNDLTLQSQRHLIFNTSDANERARITSGGNLLINTTTDTGFKLNVNAPIITTGYYGYNNTNIFYANVQELKNTISQIQYRAQDNLHYWNISNSEAMRITSNSNLLIGTTTDNGQKLQVNGGITLADNSFLTWKNSNTRIVGQSGYMVFQVAATDKMKINSNGNVLIGTTTDDGSSKLQVAGTVSQTVLGNAPNDNLNDLTTSRYFKTHVNTTNSPVSTFGMGINMVYSSGNTMQLVSSRNSADALYMRKQTNSTYSSWIKIRDENQISDTDITNWNTSYSNWQGVNGSNNWNNIDANAFIKGHTSTLNYPPDLTQSFLSGIAAMYSDGNGWQLASNRNSGSNLYLRHVVNDTWSSWKRILDSDDIYIASSGNVGIGTTSPSQKLTVEGNIELGTGGYIYGDTTTPYLRLSNAAGSVLGYSNGYISVGPSFVYNNASGEQFRISHSNGYVGIGTSSPQELLHLFKQSHSNPLLIEVENDGYLAGTSAGIKLTSKATDGVSGSWTIDNLNRDTLRFLDDGSEKMRLTSTGRLGIGTTSPSQKLHVQTANDTYAYYVSNSSGSNRGGLYIDAGGDTELKLRTGSGDMVSLKADGNSYFNGGNLGIGTASPSYLLTVDSSNSSGPDNVAFFNSASNNERILIGSANQYIEHKGSEQRITLASEGSAGTFTVRTNGSERMRLTSGGYLGIGTTSPNHLLDIESASSAASLRLRRVDNNHQLVALAGNSYSYVQNPQGALGLGGSNDNRDVYIDTSGNVGIGTTSPLSYTRLHVMDSSSTTRIYVQQNGSGQAGIDFKNNTRHVRLITDATNAFRIYDQTGTSTRLTITNSGNLLLGTTTDDGSSKLQVNGIAKVIHTDSSYANYRGQGVFFNRATSYLAPEVDNFASINVGYNGARWGNVLINGAFVKFSNGATESMRIASSLNVLIGTTTDDGSSKLQVDGDVKFLGATSGRYMWWDESLDSLRLPANTKLNMNNFILHHDGSNANVTNSVGNINIVNNSDDGNISFSSDDGVGNTTEYFRLDGSVVETKFNKDLRVVDNEKIIAGTSNDLEIFSSGADVLFRTWSGNMIFQQNYDDGDIIFQCDDGSGSVTPYITLDGSQTTINLQKTVLIGTTTNTGAYKIDVAGKQRVQDTLELDDVLMLNQISTPADPAAGKSVIYMDSADGGIKCKINVGGTVVTRTLASFE